jgi:ATPase subunit of ABC transporter with duplicated ATPase domains
VSHDEAILNDCVDSILHFFDHKVTRYKGNYSTFLVVRGEKFFCFFSPFLVFSFFRFLEQNIAAAQKKQKAQDLKIKRDRQAAQKNAGGKLGGNFCILIFASWA